MCYILLLATGVKCPTWRSSCCQFLTELSARDMIMADFYYFPFYLLKKTPYLVLETQKLHIWTIKTHTNRLVTILFLFCFTAFKKSR